ncbi:MAG: LysR family transcriptional regulator [Solirubrobacteraceae bacterium]|nr:LysR family transcriptional regulator [Solirubrobacteraceae bacterium]
MLDVRRLRVLKEVAAKGSFSAAAESLAYTQSAVSQQIAALEREAGLQLVDRSARGVHLTDAGRVLLGHADDILRRLSDAEAELEAMAGLRGGRLRLVAFPSAGASIMPEAIARFRERHPAVEMTLGPAEPDEAVEALRAGEADVGMTIETTWAKPGDDGVERTHLLDDPMYLVLPAGHPQAAKRNVSVRDVAEEAWILGSADASCPDSQILMRACNAAGFEPRIAFQSDDYNAIQGFVAAGVGVCLIPDLALTNVRRDVVVRSLGPKAPVRRISAISTAGGFCSPAKQAMLDILVETAGDWTGHRRELALAS